MVDLDNSEDVGDDFNKADAGIVHQVLVEWRETISTVTEALLDQVVEYGLELEKMDECLEDLKATIQESCRSIKWEFRHTI